MGATYISPRAEAENVKWDDGSRGADVNNIVHAAWVPNGTISHQVDDKLTLGLGLNVPYGMITKYDSEWAGSDHGITSKLMSTTVTPMAAYKLTDKLSVGAGLQMQYIKARLTSTKTVAPRMAADVALEGDTFDVGYQFGAMYEFSENTRIGVNYRSEINHKLKGDINSDKAPLFNAGLGAMLNQDISARLDTPEMISVGAYHQLNDKWALMAEYQRVNWSSFKNLDIVGESLNNQATGVISRTKENWQDTNFFALGASYQIDDQWKLRLGIAKDQAAAKKAQRTPRIPDSDRTWYSAGLSYEYNDKLTFDFAYTYIQAKNASMDTRLTGNSEPHVTAGYKNSVKLFGLSLNYKF